MSSPAEMEAFLGRLYRQNEFAIKLGLEAITSALKLLARPDRGRARLLVAGTNGKGTVTAFLSSIAHTAGLRTGTFSSPHLCHFRERIRVDGRWVDDDELLRVGTAALDRFGGRAGRDDAPAALTLTFFELATLMAVVVFDSAQTQLDVFEVGLGGRLDATNALSAELCVITPISRDHTQWLGETDDEIAFEKAGIIREGTPVVVHSSRGLEVIRRVAHDRKAPCVVLGEDFEITGNRFRGLGRDLLLPGLEGQPTHHACNVATAVAAGLVAMEHGVIPTLDDWALTRALARCTWPGRWWRLPAQTTRAIPESVEVLLDAAHNPAGARAVVDALRASGQASQPLALVINAAKDKDVRGITEALDELHFERIFVAPVSSSRIHDPQEFVAHSVWTPDRVETSAELLSAFDGALDAVSRGGMVLVMGSIYLLGELIVALGCDDALQSIFSGGDVDEV
ncbi:MAG: hypothetical protein AUK47_21845 [Deltaproteobacteria bacterium CG2_30_63_29]|nr:MAG: hypothetical protein AUK47_21845 [Deltaproteobacteria bacterium CG2_30_63_29]PJB35444.1 MAG: bifunctional folylpolyglutamate synthase/dihydrofolate synthase [Deltaproteobacteria bacterium CG_4_9_14_3_um_filter_63_12]